MSTLKDDLAELAKKLWSSPPPLPTILDLGAQQDSPFGSERSIVKDEAYFSVAINQLYLAEGRRLWATYEPMVLVIADFLYGQGATSVPAVIGPAQIKSKVTELPHGLVFNDINAIGPHPFRGGTVGLTVILYRVKRSDYAINLLKFLEGVCSAAGVPADVSLLTKIGEPLVGGLNSLLELGDTEPVLGHRINVDSGTLRGFRATSRAVIAGEQSGKQFLQSEDRLYIATPTGKAEYKDSDFVLYSINKREVRDDDRSLPFYGLFVDALAAAAAGDDESWKRAKSTLLALYQQMTTSSDLIPRQVEELFGAYKNLAVKKREAARDASLLSHGARETKDRARALNAAARLLDAI